MINSNFLSLTLISVVAVVFLS